MSYSGRYAYYYDVDVDVPRHCYLRFLDEGPDVWGDLGVLRTHRQHLKDGSLERRSNAAPHQLQNGSTANTPILRK